MKDTRRKIGELTELSEKRSSASVFIELQAHSVLLQEVIKALGVLTFLSVTTAITTVITLITVLLK